jgi:hypothetical protein
LTVSGRFQKPETLAGPYFIVAVEGASFPRGACNRDSDLVAVDLSNSRVREVPRSAFAYCSRLAAAAFPAQLVTVRTGCFVYCTALEAVDLAATAVEVIEASAFGESGLGRMSLPPSLKELDVGVFRGTPLTLLDLSASASVAVRDVVAAVEARHGVMAGGANNDLLEVSELGLPREGFEVLTVRLLSVSRTEVLYADVDMADIERLLPRLDGWAIDGLRVVSPRLEEPFEWVRNPRSRSVAVTDPALIDVTLTRWGQIPRDQLCFLRSIDLSALGELPRGEDLSGSYFLESVILPARLRILPSRFFWRCPRLSHVETTACVALEEIGYEVFRGCRNLCKFVFPVMIRKVGPAFGGTSIVCLDFSGTRAKSVQVQDMKFLEQLVLPRCCILECADGVPALRSVTFGASGGSLSWNPRQMRFESLAVPAEGIPLAVRTCIFAEVACLLDRESSPFPL